MRIGKVLALCSLGALLGAPALPATGEDAGFYAGLGAGATSIDFCSQFIGLTTCDDQDTGLRFFVGHRVNPNVAVEIGFTDLGEITATGPGGTARISSDGIQVAVRGIGPVSPQVNVFGKAGLFFWDAKATAPGLSLTDNGTDITFGLGLGLSVSRQAELRLEWERFDLDGDNIDMFSLAVQLNF